MTRSCPGNAAVSKRKQKSKFRMYLMSDFSEVSIILDCKKVCEVELTLSYIVRDASWTPSYDVRVFSGEKQMKVASNKHNIEE